MKQKKSWLNNKTVVLTGVSGGLGKELARELIFRYNANVIGIARNAEKLSNVKAEFNSDKFTGCLFDVSKNANWEDFALNLAKKSIKIDVLINNAGIMPPFSRFENLTLETCENVINTNFFSSIYSVRNLLPLLKQSDSAAIINIASACAFSSVIGTSIYSASKAALKAFTDSMREENKKHIYVAGVYPGFIKTELFRNQPLAGRIEKFASDAKVIAKRIAHKIHKKQKHIVVGSDGKLLRFASIIMPNKTTPIMTKVLTGSGEENFKGLKDD